MRPSKPLLVVFRDSAWIAGALDPLQTFSLEHAEVSTFRSGEMRVTGPKHVPRHVLVLSDISEDPASCFRAMILAEGLRSSGARRVELLAPWIAYGRQDRTSEPG